MEADIQLKIAMMKTIVIYMIGVRQDIQNLEHFSMKEIKKYLNGAIQIILNGKNILTMALLED